MAWIHYDEDFIGPLYGIVEWPRALSLAEVREIELKERELLKIQRRLDAEREARCLAHEAERRRNKAALAAEIQAAMEHRQAQRSKHRTPVYSARLQQRWLDLGATKHQAANQAKREFSLMCLRAWENGATYKEMGLKVGVTGQAIRQYVEYGRRMRVLVRVQGPNYLPVGVDC